MAKQHRAAARLAGTKITRIGRFARGAGVKLTAGGRVVAAPRRGYVHF